MQIKIFSVLLSTISKHYFQLNLKENGKIIVKKMDKTDIFEVKSSIDKMF